MCKNISLLSLEKIFKKISNPLARREIPCKLNLKPQALKLKSQSLTRV